MKSRSILQTVAVALGLGALVGCSTIDELFDRDQEVRAEDLPPKVLSAAREAVPGLDIREAEQKKNRDGETVYEVEGRSGETKHELLIAADGTVLADTTDD